MSTFTAVFIDTRNVLQLPSSKIGDWGNPTAPQGKLTWRMSYFKTKFVNVVYTMLTQR